MLMLVAPCVLLGSVIWSELQRGATLTGAVERFAPFLAVGGVLALGVYRIAHTIVRRETEASLEFRTFIGRRVVSVMDITSIAPGRLQSGQLVVRHSHGSVVMPAQFSGCHELLEWIRTRNPSVVLNGI
jgi:hypothetical protein